MRRLVIVGVVALATAARGRSSQAGIRSHTTRGGDPPPLSYFGEPRSA
jgi:hypothetical protein